MKGGWSVLVDAAVVLRRELHRRPELAWAENATARTIRHQLDLAEIPWRACAGTGTIATLAPDASGRHIALRADIDGMPVHEASGVDWTSLNDGVMHACGHDGHMATLFAAAWWLRQHEDDLPGPVSLLFQPAEEGGHGAKRMIDDGALEDVCSAGRDTGGMDRRRPVEVIFGWHNWPGIPYGRAVCPDGPVMSANGSFEIEVLGKGGHASQPEACRDPILAASAITLALQQIVSRRLPAQQAAVVAVTSIMAPSGVTVTPDRAVLSGSIRIADTSQRDIVFGLITQIAADTAQAHGVTAITTPVPRYGATVNHPVPAAELRDALRADLGDDWHSAKTPVPLMASEDFSYYLERIPGAFALVGADDGAAHSQPCHSSRYDFNDVLIPRMAGVYTRLAGVPVPDVGRIVDPAIEVGPDDLEEEDQTWT